MLGLGKRCECLYDVMWLECVVPLTRIHDSACKIFAFSIEILSEVSMKCVCFSYIKVS